MQKLYIISISIISLVSTWWHSKVDPTDCFTDGKQRYGFICDNVLTDRRTHRQTNEYTDSKKSPRDTKNEFYFNDMDVICNNHNN